MLRQPAQDGTGGRRTLAVRFLDGEFRVATGPAHLALTTGAPILPVFTIAEAPGDFEHLDFGVAVQAVAGLDLDRGCAGRAQCGQTRQGCREEFVVISNLKTTFALSWEIFPIRRI